MITKARGFVFSKYDVNDADRIFSVFTYEFGRIEVFGKAIRKIHSKLRSGIDILCLSDIEFFQGRSKKTLTDAKIIKKFSEALYDVERFAIMAKVADYLRSVIKESQHDEHLFLLLEEIFTKLDNKELNQKEKNILTQYFIWNLLSLQGRKPHMDACVVCKEGLKADELYFSIKEGGTLCLNCSRRDPSADRDAKKINSDIIKIVRLITKKDWATLSKLSFSPSSQKLLEEISDLAINNVIHE